MIKHIDSRGEEQVAFFGGTMAVSNKYTYNLTTHGINDGDLVCICILHLTVREKGFDANVHILRSNLVPIMQDVAVRVQPLGRANR